MHGRVDGRFVDAKETKHSRNHGDADEGEGDADEEAKDDLNEIGASHTLGVIGPDSGGDDNREAAGAADPEVKDNEDQGTGAIDAGDLALA